MLAIRMGRAAAPPKPSRWAVGTRLLVMPFLQTVLHHQWSDDYRPMISELLRFEGPDFDRRSLALRFVVLRGLAEHWLVHPASGQPHEDGPVMDFIDETAQLLDPEQAPALMDGLMKLNLGEPRPWLKVSPY